MKKILIILLSLVLITTLASAEQRNFNLSSDQLLQTSSSVQTYYTSAIALEVDTTLSATCKYSSTKDREYGSMEGTFDYNFETAHKKTIDLLEEGLYKYYVKCMLTNGTIPNTQLEVIFKIIKPISAQILLSEESPLKAGQYEITLVTSKIPSQKPTLTYSIDGLVYDPVPLSSTSTETAWKGYIVIPASVGETIGSFKFSAKDLEGILGDKITKNSVFIIDTKKPTAIGTIKIEGHTGQIRLEWYNDEEVKEYQIFRSIEPQVDYTDYYDTTDERYFLDNSVERGKTYYYRVAPVDNAENIADLSREVSATALLDNSTKINGLRLELRSSVDNLLSSISILNGNINDIKTSFENKNSEEKDIIDSLQLIKEITNAQSELTSLSKEVESYKSQDLTKEELDKKINSANLKINIIKKKIPESITIQDKKTIERVIDEDKINNLLIEYSEELTESELNKVIKASLKVVKETEVEIKSQGYNLELVYIDGTRKTQTVIKEKINSDLERMQNTSITMFIPESIAESASEITLRNTGYKIVKENLVIQFDSDTKEIVYSIGKKADLKYLDDVLISPIQIATTTSSTITGNAIYDFSSIEEINYKIVIPIIAVILLLIIIIKLNSAKRKVNKLFREIEKDIANKRIEEAKEKYKKIKNNYSTFSKKEKRLVYKKTLELQKKLGGN